MTLRSCGHLLTVTKQHTQQIHPSMCLCVHGTNELETQWRGTHNWTTTCDYLSVFSNQNHQRKAKWLFKCSGKNRSGEPFTFPCIRSWYRTVGVAGWRERKRRGLRDMATHESLELRSSPPPPTLLPLRRYPSIYSDFPFSNTSIRPLLSCLWFWSTNELKGGWNLLMAGLQGTEEVIEG